MRIYFAGSIRGGRDDKDIYMQIIDDLRQYGEVLTEHIGDANLGAAGEASKDPKFIHDRDLNWLEMADIIVAEVSQPSLGVGYEIGKATEWGKRIVCLYCPSKTPLLSSMILGCDRLSVFKYENIEDVQNIFRQVFAVAPA